MDPLAGEVILSSELLMQNGAALYYPDPRLQRRIRETGQIGQTDITVVFNQRAVTFASQASYGKHSDAV